MNTKNKLIVKMPILLILIIFVSSCSLSPFPLLDNEQDRDLAEALKPIDISKYTEMNGVYIVKRGDTLWGISKKFNIKVETILTLNNITASDVIKIGQKLRLSSKYIATPIAHSNPYPKTYYSGISPKKRIKETSSMPKLSIKGMCWPIENKSITNISKRNYGIIIGAYGNSPVCAIKDGYIEYVYRDLNTLDQIIIIKHNDNTFSFYAFLTNVNIKKGDRIKAGEQIAFVSNIPQIGQSGILFSLYNSSGSINPMSYLPRR